MLYKLMNTKNLGRHNAKIKHENSALFSSYEHENLTPWELSAKMDLLKKVFKRDIKDINTTILRIILITVKPSSHAVVYWCLTTSHPPSNL